jgi:hypothetical protein
MTTTIVIALIASVSINIFLLIYIKWLLKNFSYVTDNLEKVWALVEEFQAHVKMLNELEMYYGDETLQALLEHSKKVTEAIDTYQSYLFPPLEDEIQEIEEHGGTTKDD